jgi:uncharacterized LabA/DUF88 family protein/uncharacterized coiled-coil DUF342 family protein
MVTPYQRIVGLFDEKALSWIIEHALDRQALVKLSNVCGVSYAGMRTKSVPSEKLALDLVRHFFDKELVGEQIVKVLGKASAQEMAELRRAEVAAVRSSAQPNGSSTLRQFSRLVVALALDDREEAHETVPVMLHKAEPYFHQEVRPPEPADAEARPASGASPHPETDTRLARNGKDLDQALRAACDERERLEQQNKTLEARLGQLREQIKQLQIEIDTLRHDNRTFEKTVAEKDRELQHLKESLHQLPALTTQINQLERENRKLRYQLDKQPSPDQAALVLNPLVQTFDRNAEEIRESVRATFRTIESEYGDLRRTIDDLQKEMHTLRIEIQRERQPPSRLHRTVRRDQERVGIFVDVQNMFYAARQHDARLDFEKLMQAAVGERRLIRAVAYVIQTPEVDQTGFVAMLQQRSYQVRRKDLRLRSDGSAKGDWDMGMAIDMIGMADKLDVMVLVSGDGDFVSLVHLLKEMGPRVEVFSFPHNTARDLMEAADQYYAIDDTLLIKMDRQTAPANREPEQPGVTVE